MVNADPNAASTRDGRTRLVQISSGKIELEAAISIPPGALGMVLFSHGSGSTHSSPRNQRVMQVLQRQRLGCLVFDALMPSERREDAIDERLRFDIGLLSRRLVLVTDWTRTQELPIGYFGAGSGTAAALVAAAERQESVLAVVCRSGRPGLAASALRKLRAPTLLIVGSEDPATLALNQRAAAQLDGARLEVVPGAGHLFEERGTLDIASELAGRWFVRHFAAAAGSSSTC